MSVGGSLGGEDPSAVVGFELWRVQYPLVHAHRAAHGTEDRRDLVLVSATFDDGTVGWGECSALAHPTYTGEYTAGAWAVLRDEFLPAVLAGRPPRVVGHPMAQAAVLTALSDGLLRQVQRPLATELAAMLGGNPAHALARCAVVGRAAGEASALVARVDELVADGVAMVKVKVSADPADVAAVAEVRAAWPDLRLAVDCNGHGDPEALRVLDGLDLAYIEQPAPADQLVASAQLAAELATPVALDESVSTPGELDAAVALAAGSMLNVKPARCGGPHAAAAMVARARSAGLGVFVGGMLESGVGRSAALAVAAVPGLTMPTDLGPSTTYVDEDLTEPIVCDPAGQVLVPDGPGIARVPRPDRLDALAVDRLALRR